MGFLLGTKQATSCVERQILWPIEYNPYNLKINRLARFQQSYKASGF